MRQERRGAPRVPEQLSCSLTDDGGAITAETKNISTAGAYCLLDRFIAPMTKLQLDFLLPTMPKPARIRCAGVVVRAEPVAATADRGAYHIAILFQDMPERDRAAIASFVRQRLAARAAPS